MRAGSATDFLPYRAETLSGGSLPLIIEANGRPDVSLLTGWLAERARWVQDALTEHGAILLRGFAVRDAAAFERVARAIAPDLSTHFLGTPGRRLTDFVFPSSEGSLRFPVAPHCEMSYLLVPPRRIFFGCLVAPAVGSGETPLVDVRTVWRTLDPHVRERFVRRGIRIVRNLRGPASRFRLWTQVRWDDFFQTADRATIEAQCRAEHFGFAWTADDGLRLTITQPVTRTHPVTGETAWVNQFLADHAASSAHEYRRIFRLRPSFRLWRTWQFVRLTALLKLRSPLSTLAFHCTYADGSRIPVADMNALRATVWRHLAIPPWQAGDVMAIDNLAVAHGRLPCWGPRQIVACLAR